MRKIGRHFLRRFIEITHSAKIYEAEKVLADGKPKIYISNCESPRYAVTARSALNCTIILPCSEYNDSAVLRTVNSRRVITSDEGFNTEWLHSALRRLKSGESLLICPKTPDPDVGNAGAVLLSLLSGAEIVPLYSGSERRSFWRLKITAGTPIAPSENSVLTSEWINAEITRVNNAMRSRRCGVEKNADGA